MNDNRQKSGKPHKKNVFVVIYSLFVLMLFSGLTYNLLSGNENQASPSVDIAQLEGELSGEIKQLVKEFEGAGEQLEPAKSAIAAEVTIRSPEAQTEPAWQSEAAEWHTTEKPKLAIIIDDLGMTQSATREFAQIKGPLTMAFLPYAPNLTHQTKVTRNAGHELMVHLPMQSQNDEVDHGKNALFDSLSYEEFNERVAWNLNQFEGFVGVNNHMGSKLTENPGHMVRLMQQLQQKGHLFIDSMTTPNSVGASSAKAAGVPYAVRDVFLDNIRTVDYIKGQLAQAEQVARKRGYAIAIGHPYPETIAVIDKWRQSNDARGIVLVPASQIVLEAIERRIEQGR